MSDETSPTNPKPQPWDRQEDESYSQYLAFVCYRDMPEGNFLNLLHARDYKGDKTINRYTLTKWAEEYRWVERRAAFWLNLRESMDEQNRQILIEEDRAARAEMVIWRQNMRATGIAASAKMRAILEDPGAVNHIKPGDLIAMYKAIQHEQHLVNGEATSLTGETVIKTSYDAKSPRVLAAEEEDAREEARRQAELEADSEAVELPAEKQRRVGE